MRQLWISVGILVVMVALLFWNVAKVDQLTQPMLKELSQATTAAQGDDWSKAEVLTQQIQVLGKLTGKLEAIQEQERVSAENLF